VPLKDFGHCSSAAVSEMILLISEVVAEKIVGEITKCHIWSSMVDETNDISTFKQYITFVRYVVKGQIKVRFLDIRKVDKSGATASNLFAMFKSVAADCQLDLKKHVAIATDGAAAMTGRHNSLAQKLKTKIGTMVSVHCHAHRLALACCDTVADLYAVRKCESTFCRYGSVLLFHRCDQLAWQCIRLP